MLQEHKANSSDT
uniref:Uncharacterized protein n=1 Tax=Musa acuminata subsp. malaccensis TaxID=214687 RepID=A0A804IRG4_MUSAM